MRFWIFNFVNRRLFDFIMKDKKKVKSTIVSDELNCPVQVAGRINLGVLIVQIRKTSPKLCSMKINPSQTWTVVSKAI